MALPDNDNAHMFWKVEHSVGFTIEEDEGPCNTRALALVALAFCSRALNPGRARCQGAFWPRSDTGWRWWWPRPGPCRVWWVMQGGAARAQSRGLAAAAVDLRHDESPRTLGARSPPRQRAARAVTFRRCARHQHQTRATLVSISVILTREILLGR